MTLDVKKYKKKPVEVEAVQFDGSQKQGFEIVDWINGHLRIPEAYLNSHYETTITDIETALHIPTLEGMMTAEKDWWIIRGVEGEFYPCKDSVFRSTHEKATTTTWRNS